MATDKVDIGETSSTDRQLASCLKETFGQLATGALHAGHIQALNEHRHPFALESPNVDVNDRVEWWYEHFKRLYRINSDFSGLLIPKQVPGFDRLVIIPKGLTHRKCVEAALTIHGVDLYKDDLDGSVRLNDRTPKVGSYGIWIRDHQEADEELKGKSANDLKTSKIGGITLLERLVAGNGYLFESMSHMDRHNVTLCSGSRCSDGDIPGVSWSTDGRRLDVDWCHPLYSDPALRARAVVCNP